DHRDVQGLGRRRPARRPCPARRRRDLLRLSGGDPRGDTPRLMSFPTPFDQYEGEVLPEWIDANGHMNLAYYVVLFDYATDALFEAIGIGYRYKDTTNHGTFVAETHNLYERELLVGERVRVATQILAADNKRLHLAHEM